jgi:hypothetical protein
MNVIWVAQDNNKDDSFIQTKSEILCTVSCVAFIKHYYPNFKTNLFVDKNTKKYYEQFGVLDIFDVVNDSLLSQNSGINTKIYWASGKILAQNLFEGPTLTLDLDFRFYDDIKNFGIFDSDISCLWLEDIQNIFYISPQEAMLNTNLELDIPFDKNAFNTSFLYIKNNDFRKKYCEFAIQYMKSNYDVLLDDMEFIERTKYMMFVEQYMLRQFSNKYKQKVKLLIDDFTPIPSNDLSLESCGINMINCGNYFYHFGDHKKKMLNKEQHFYDEIRNCHYITNNKITNQSHLNIFNKIYNMSEYERCFC